MYITLFIIVLLLEYDRYQVKQFIWKSLPGVSNRSLKDRDFLGMGDGQFNIFVESLQIHNKMLEVNELVNEASLWSHFSFIFICVQISVHYTLAKVSISIYSFQEILIL